LSPVLWRLVLQTILQHATWHQLQLQLQMGAGYFGGTDRYV